MHVYKVPFRTTTLDRSKQAVPRLPCLSSASVTNLSSGWPAQICKSSTSFSRIVRCSRSSVVDAEANAGHVRLVTQRPCTNRSHVKLEFTVRQASGDDDDDGELTSL